MAVQAASGPLPLAVLLDERLQGSHQLAPVVALGGLDRAEDRVAEQPQRLVVLEREQQLEGAQVLVRCDPLGCGSVAAVRLAGDAQRQRLQSTSGLVEAAAGVAAGDRA